MSFRKNLYFNCKHCGRDSYIDDTKFAFDDFGNGNLNGNQEVKNERTLRTLRSLFECGFGICQKRAN